MYMSENGKQLGSGVLEIPVLQAYVNTTAARAGLRVEFEDGGKCPRTNKDRILIPTPTARITQDDITTLRHAVLHEVGHHTEGPELFQLGEDNGLRPGEEGLGTLVNAFEDSRIERSLAKKYLGDKEILIEARGIHYGKIDGKSLRKIEPDDKDGTCVVTSLALMAETDSEWNTSDVLHKHTFLDQLPPHVKVLLDKCEKAGITEALKHTRSVDDVFKLAKSVYEMIYEKSADEHIKELKKQQAASKAAAGKDGEGTGKTPMDAKSKRMKDAYAKYMPQTMDEGFADPDGGGLHLDYTDYKASDWVRFTPCPPEDIACFDMRLNKDVCKARSPRMDRRDASWVRAYKNEANAKTLANKIRRFLQVKSQAYYVANQTKGKIHQKNLYRVAVPRVGDGQWNSRVFKKREQNDVLDVAVTVLVDYSGSMGGQKIHDAIKSSMILTECLSHGLRVPVEVLGFTESGDTLNMLLIKGFDDRASMEIVGERMCPGMSIMCQNNDGDAVLFAYHRLRNRKEKRKMLFVLSDGSPASSRPGDVYGYTKQIVDGIEKQGIVDMFGIGIQDRNVTRIYKKHEVLSDSSQLEDKLLKIVQRRIINEEAH